MTRGRGERRWRDLRCGATTLVLAAGLGVNAGCHHWDDCDDCDPGFHPDTYPPAAPRGVETVTGDHEVEIYWLANTERDLDGYRLYRNEEPDGYFRRIATVGRSSVSFVDRDVRNGETYYYALAAFDDAGNESELSSELAFDTPRPEGRDLRLSNSVRVPAEAGYDFSARRVVDVASIDADIYYWQTEEDGAWLVATERSGDVFTDIQDVGFARFDEIGWAPEGGWAPSGDVPLIEGHVYVIWTWDDHYAKVRVVSLGPNSVVLDWAYQLDPGNPELRAFVEDGSTDLVTKASDDHGSSKPAAGAPRVHRVGAKVR